MSGEATLEGAGHTLSREYKGRNESQTITPKCSCGWVGRSVYQYQDTPIMDLISQETEHIRSAPTEPDSGRKEG